MFILVLFVYYFSNSVMLLDVGKPICKVQWLFSTVLVLASLKSPKTCCPGKCSYMSLAHSLVLERLLLSSWTPTRWWMEVYCFDMGLLKGPHHSSWLFIWPIHQMLGGQQWLGCKKTSIVLSIFETNIIPWWAETETWLLERMLKVWRTSQSLFGFFFFPLLVQKLRPCKVQWVYFA